VKVSNKNRRIELDIAKGIGIILVVWAHAQGPFSNYISAFHMPFFFFISGMLYMNKRRSVKEYTLKKCTSLLMPFLWWNLIFYPVFFVLYYWKSWDIGTALKDTGEIVLTFDKVPFLGATWFLPSLFWVIFCAHVFVSVFQKYKWCDWGLLNIGIIIAVVGFQITFPYRISRTLICFLFYVSGYIYQKYIRSHIKYVVELILSIIFIAVYIWITNIFASVLASNTYDNKFLFIIGAFLAIPELFMVTNISMKMTTYSFSFKLVA
jgi:fucose 4-O-acetylase-like acetyltransferase